MSRRRQDGDQRAVRRRRPRSGPAQGRRSDTLLLDSSDRPRARETSRPASHSSRGWSTPNGRAAHRIAGLTPSAASLSPRESPPRSIATAGARLLASAASGRRAPQRPWRTPTDDAAGPAAGAHGRGAEPRERDHRSSTSGSSSISSRTAVARSRRSRSPSASPKQRCARAPTGSSSAGILQIVGVTDPLKLGFQQQAMIGVALRGRRCCSRRPTTINALPRGRLPGRHGGVLRPARRGGLRGQRWRCCSFLTEKLRQVDGVRETETFVYLRMVKQIYSWGTR